MRSRFATVFFFLGGRGKCGNAGPQTRCGVLECTAILYRDSDSESRSAQSNAMYLSE